MDKNELYRYHGGLGFGDSQDELYHFGVKGMRWGQRKQVITGAKAYARAQGLHGKKRREVIKRDLERHTKARVDRFGAKKVIRANRRKRVNSAIGRGIAIAALEGVARNSTGAAKYSARLTQAAVLGGGIYRQLALRADNKRAKKYAKK